MSDNAHVVAVELDCPNDVAFQRGPSGLSGDCQIRSRTHRPGRGHRPAAARGRIVGPRTRPSTLLLRRESTWRMCKTPSLAGTTDHSADHRLRLASGSPGERSPARIGPGQAMRLPMIDRCALNEHSVSPLKPEEPPKTLSVNDCFASWPSRTSPHGSSSHEIEEAPFPGLLP